MLVGTPQPAPPVEAKPPVAPSGGRDPVDMVMPRGDPAPPADRDEARCLVSPTTVSGRTVPSSNMLPAAVPLTLASW